MFVCIYGLCICDAVSYNAYAAYLLDLTLLCDQELGDIGDLFTDLDKLMEATPTDSNPAPISRQFQDSSMLDHDRNALVTTTFGLHSLADGGRPPSRE